MSKKRKTGQDAERQRLLAAEAAAEVTEILREERGEVTDELIEIAARDAERTPEKQELLDRERAKRDSFYSDLLFSLTNIRYAEHEARLLWVNLLAHKTEMSDRLGRNVGVRVAALDYFKNIVGMLDEVRIVGGADFIETELLAVTDGLTGLFNHRYFQDRLERTLVRAAETRQPVSLLMIDIDYFKQYNDLNGHIAGDVALREMAAILRRSVKRDDVVARYGGEEFAVVMASTGREAARGAAERLRTEAEKAEFPNEQVLPGGNLTISVGLATFPDDAADRAGLIERADAALYSAKHGGRNRVCWRPEECRTVERVNATDLRAAWRPAGPDDGVLLPARLRDVSSRGAALGVENPPPPGSRLVVALTGGFRGKRLDVPALVIWCQEVPGSWPLVGVVFEPDGPEVRAELARLTVR
ncbi:MAG TPA: diguanylate cyclase [Planctomycetota bacterium]|nr:diguanylate cyclase [Planctomycetota bacterium]